MIQLKTGKVQLTVKPKLEALRRRYFVNKKKQELTANPGGPGGPGGPTFPARPAKPWRP